jgi:hypothetical protein
MEIEQRDVANCLHRKGMKLPAIVAELAAIDHEDAFDGNKVKYRLHEIKQYCSDLSDRPSSGRRLLKISMLEFCKSWKLSHGFGSSDRRVPQDSCVDSAPPSKHLSQREKPTFQMDSSFS